MTDRLRDFIERYFVFVLLFLSALLFFLNLQSRDFWAPDEGDFALIVKELKNNPVVPHLNNIPYGEKPPLFYYLTYLSKGIFFFLKDEVSLRLVSGISALSFVLFFFITLSRYRDKGHAIFSALILISSPLFYWQARYLQVDMVFSVFICLSLLFFFKYYRESVVLFYYLFYIFLGLAFMTKGPLTLALVCPVAITMSISKKKLRLIMTKHTIAGIIIFLAIALPWYVMIYLKEGLPFLYENIIRQNILRFFDAWSHKRPFYYYLTTLPLDFFPWSLFLPFGIYYAIKNIRHDDLMGFFIIWFFWMFIFLSLSSGKISKYMLPALPAAAFMVASTIKKDQGVYNTLVFYLISLIFLILGGLLFVFKVDTYTDFKYVRICLGCICVLTSLFMFFFAKGRRLSLAFFTLFSGIAVVFLIANISVYEKVNKYKSPKPISEKIKSLTSNGTPWVYYGSIRGVYVYYADNFAIHIDDHKEDDLAALRDKNNAFFILTRKRDVDDVKRVLKDVSVISEYNIGDTQMVILEYKNKG